MGHFVQRGQRRPPGRLVGNLLDGRLHHGAGGLLLEAMCLGPPVGAAAFELVPVLESVGQDGVEVNGLSRSRGDEREVHFQEVGRVGLGGLTEPCHDLRVESAVPKDGTIAESFLEGGPQRVEIADRLVPRHSAVAQSRRLVLPQVLFGEPRVHLGEPRGVPVPRAEPARGARHRVSSGGVTGRERRIALD